MMRYVIIVLSLVSVSVVLACESPQSTPKTTSAPVNSTTQRDQPPAVPPKAPQEAINTVQPQRKGTCVPVSGVKPRHEDFACIREAVPPEKIIILRSRGDLKRFISRMTRSCELPSFDFNQHSLVIYKGTASCDVEVEDKFCDGQPWTYHVTLTADGFCERLAEETRFWQVPQLNSKDIINIKRVRRRKP